MSINLLNEVVMEIKNEAGQVFRAQFPNGVTLQECFGALKAFADQIITMGQENEQKAQAAQAAAGEQPASQDQPIEPAVTA
jgi:hypothetical protein